METPSIGGSFYFLTFIDDYIRNTWVYFLKKSVVFERVHQYKALVEKKIGHYIKVLTTESDGECMLNGFLQFCR